MLSTLQRANGIKALESRREAIAARLKELSTFEESRDLTPEELNEVKRLSRECDDVKSKLTMMSRKTSPHSRSRPDDDDDERQSTHGSSRGRKDGARFSALFGPISAIEAVESPGDGTATFRNAGDFIQAVHRGIVSEGLRVYAAAGESLGSSGGFSVPVQYAAQWLDASLEDEIVRPRADVFGMESDTRKAPGFDASDNSATLFGGFNGQWLAEGQSASKTTPKLRLIELVAKKLALYSNCSNELLQDGLGYEEQLSAAIVAAISWYMDYAFLRGTGTGQPLGVLNDPALITIAKESLQATATLNATNLIKMYARMHPRLITGSVWVCNPSCIPELFQLNQGIESAPLFAQSLNDDVNDRLFGRPILYTEKLPVLGTKGDIILVNFTQYAIGMRREMTLDRSQAPGWTEDVTDFRSIVRVAGMGKWNKPMTPKNGNAMSWCVALETRQ